MKYLIPLVLLFALGGCENDSAGSRKAGNDVGDTALQAMVGQRGLYKLVRSGGLVDDPTTSTGKSVSKPVVQLVKSTERIPLIKGAQMYLQYRLWYLPEQPAYVDLRRVLRHPEMALPDGTVSTGSDFMIKTRLSINQAIGYTGYGLDEDYELVEGDWIFEIWYDGKKMIEQKFTTYWPAEEEVAELESWLSPKKSTGIGTQSPKQSFDRRNWPRKTIGIGGDADGEPAGSSTKH